MKTIKKIIREEIENDFDDFFITEEESFNGQYVFDPPITRKEWVDKVLPALDKFHIGKYDKDGMLFRSPSEGIRWCCSGNIRPTHIPSDFDAVTRIFSVDIGEDNVLRTMAKPHWSYNSWLGHMEREEEGPIHNGRLVFNLEDLPKKNGWLFESDGFKDSTEEDWEWAKGSSTLPLSHIPYNERMGQMVMISKDSEYYEDGLNGDSSNPINVEGRIYEFSDDEDYDGGHHYIVDWGRETNSYPLGDLIIFVK